jgi:cell division protein FtsN
MRLFFLLVLLANLATFAYLHYIDGRSGADAQMALLQISPEKVKLVKAGALHPAANREKPALSAVCVEWGAFGADDAVRAAAALARLDLGGRITQRETIEGFWVHIPPMKTLADAEKKVAEVRSLGVTDFFIVRDAGPAQYALSLGVFRTEEAANNHLAQLRPKGVRSAIVAPFGAAATMFVIREPGEAVTTKLAELKAEFPAAVLKAVACADAQSAKN